MDYIILFSNSINVGDICGELGLRIARLNTNNNVGGGGGGYIAAVKAFANLIHHWIGTLRVNWSTFVEPLLHLLADLIDILEDEDGGTSTRTINSETMSQCLQYYVWSSRCHASIM